MRLRRWQLAKERMKGEHIAPYCSHTDPSQHKIRNEIESEEWRTALQTTNTTIESRMRNGILIHIIYNILWRWWITLCSGSTCSSTEKYVWQSAHCTRRHATHCADTQAHTHEHSDQRVRGHRSISLKIIVRQHELVALVRARDGAFGRGWLSFQWAPHKRGDFITYNYSLILFKHAACYMRCRCACTVNFSINFY